MKVIILKQKSQVRKPQSTKLLYLMVRNQSALKIKQNKMSYRQT